MCILMFRFLVLIMAVLACPVSQAETWPAKPIRIVVPFAPGGGSDAVARAISTKLGAGLGQSVIVDNKPGAGGVLATVQVAAAPADGYTLLLADVPFAANISVYAKPGYKLDDFAAVAQIATVPSIVIVGQHVPVKSLAELVALAKSKPAQLNMASGGAGGVAHLQGARFAYLTGITWTHVPYRGMGPAALDVIGGQADLMFASAPTVMGHLKSGRVKALAVTSSTRSPLAPEVPTMAELGYPEMTADNWFGVVAPAKTDPAIVKKLHDQINAAIASPEVKALLAAQMATPAPEAKPQDFERVVKREIDIWAKTVKAANISAN